MLATASRTQATPALSSCEAEIIAANEASKEGVCLKNLLNQIGGKVEMIELKCDASAAVAFGNRTGLGRVKHLELRHLWVQEQIQDKQLKMTKVSSEENLADIFTKALPEQRFQTLAQQIGMRAEEEETKEQAPAENVLQAIQMHKVGACMMVGSEQDPGQTAVCNRCGMRLRCPRCPPPYRPGTAQARATAARGEATQMRYGLDRAELLGTGGAGSSTTINIQTMQVNTAVRERAAAREGAAESSSDESRPTVRQLDYARALLRQRGVSAAETDSVIGRVATKTAATMLIRRLLAGGEINERV